MSTNRLIRLARSASCVRRIAVSALIAVVVIGVSSRDSLAQGGTEAGVQTGTEASMQGQISADQGQREEQMFGALKQAEPLMAAKHFVEARKLLLDTVKLDPTSNSGNLHSMLGFVDQQLGDLEEAIHESQLAMKFEPKLVDLNWNIAMAYKDLGEYATAREWTDRYLSSNPTDLKRKEEAEGMMKKLGEQASLNGTQSVHAPDYLDALISQHGAACWPRQSFPLKIFVEKSEGIPGVPADSDEMLQSAFEAWNRASGGLLPFEFVNNHKRADINIRWTNKPDKVSSHDGTHLEQGVTVTERALLPGVPITIVRKADITLLTVQRETGEVVPAEELKGVCLHEVGHALGIGGHSSNSADTMYFSTSARQLPALSHRDKNTIAKLYAAGAPSLQQQPTAAAPRRSFFPPFGQAFPQRFPGQGQYPQQSPYGRQAGGFVPAQNPYMQNQNQYQQPQMQNPYRQQQQYNSNPYQQQPQYQSNPYQQQQPQYQSNPYQQQPNPYQQNPYQQQQNPYQQQQYQSNPASPSNQSNP